MLLFEVSDIVPPAPVIALTLRSPECAVAVPICKLPEPAVPATKVNCPPAPVEPVISVDGAGMIRSPPEETDTDPAGPPPPPVALILMLPLLPPIVKALALV